MRNAILLCCYNTTPAQLALTKAAVASALDQDLPVDLYLVDNGSTDDGATWDWLQSIAAPHICLQRNPVNQSPVVVVNSMLADLFDRLGYDYVLGMPNDVRIRPDTYRQLLGWPRGLVTASQTDDPALDIHAPEHAAVAAVSEHTPMALALIRRWFWQALVAKDGYFLDERYEHYCSDCDLALRMASCGIRGIQLSLPFWHFGSASHRLALADVARSITDKADQDRQRFIDKWGFPVTAYEYGARAADINFRGEARQP